MERFVFLPNTGRDLFFQKTRNSVNFFRFGDFMFLIFIADNCISIFDTAFNLQICNELLILLMHAESECHEAAAQA